MVFRFAAVLVAFTMATGGSAKGVEAGAPFPEWDLALLEKPPQTWPAAEFLDTCNDIPKTGGGPEEVFTGEGVEALFYAGLPWRGQPTRVFAWYARPERQGNEKVPAMVLVHGGGGTAFDEWVRLWNRRGYAAIAMDVTGSRPGGKPGERPRHEWGGPPHGDDYGESGLPFQDQWPYHAVADVMLANSLLRSFPEIDSKRIGLTGISWGGYLTCVAAGVDHRFQFAVPVYGCGFLNESPAFQSAREANPEGARRWFELWDASHFVPRIACPTLWVNGANDPFFPLNIYGKSFALCGGARNLSIQVGLAHSHVHGWQPKEIDAFADSFAKHGAPLARVIGQGVEASSAWAAFEARIPPQHAELVWTDDVQDWVGCAWRAESAPIDAAGDKVRVALPDGCRAYFFRLIDDRSLVITSAVTAP